MISPVTKDISGFSVHFRPLPATKAVTLAKRVGSIILPLFKTLDLTDLNKEVDFSTLFETLSDTLSNLPDEKLVGILVDSLKGSTITAPGQAPIEIGEQKDVDAVFQGELEAMYQIVFEAWKYNKLAPFKFAARFGFRMNETGTSGEAADSETKHGPKLALSGASAVK